MGDSKGTLNLEINEGNRESTKAPELYNHELMASRASLDLLRGQSSNAAELCGLPSNKDLLEQLSEAPQLPRCEAPTHEKLGPLEVTKDECGQVFEVKDNRGHTFTKRADGKWTEHNNDNHYADDVVENLKVDDKGNMTYDYNNEERNVHVKHEWNADGSFAFTDEFGKTSYNSQAQVIEAPAGNDHVRKYHYDEKGQLDQIDGVLGHWDRTAKDGQVSWTNKDTGAVWQGDFKLNGGDQLVYKGQNGADWTFTQWGTDVNNAGKDR